MRMHVASAAVLALFSLAPIARSAEPVEQIVAPKLSQGDLFTLSPKGLHLAAVVTQNGKRVVLIDGQPGQPFDSILPAAAVLEEVYGPVGQIIERQTKQAGAVAFSPDGKRYAYAGQSGEDVIVIVDGQEQFRTKFSPAGPAVKQLRFSPDSKRAMFLTPTTDTMTSTCLVVDGKPGPGTQNGAFPVFSPDGARYAYVATKPKGDGMFLVIDGAVADYVGDRPRFSGDGQHLFTLKREQTRDKISASVLRDGKPVVSDFDIAGFVPAPAGTDVASVTVDQKNQKHLFINDKPVPEADGASQVVFSPDGRRWAAVGVVMPNQFVVIDGKKGPPVQLVRELAFTADSSKCVYVADNQNRYSVVINGQAGPVYEVLRVSPKWVGGYLAYAGGANLGAINVHHNDKVIPTQSDVMDITLSPDGTRFGYYTKAGASGPTLVLDGQPQPAFGGDFKPILFSPDNQHTVTLARPEKGVTTLLIDGQLVPVVNGLQPGEPLGFTPDSQHLLTRRLEPTPGGAGAFGVYLDGRKVAMFDGFSRNFPALVMWEANADGTVTLLGGTPEGDKAGPVKRITIDPKQAGTTLASIYTDAATQQAAAEKQVADAKAAKLHADADAKAARDKTNADAAAAKVKAREDAIAKKQAAAAEKAAAKKKAQQK